MTAILRIGKQKKVFAEAHLDFSELNKRNVSQVLRQKFFLDSDFTITYIDCDGDQIMVEFDEDYDVAKMTSESQRLILIVSPQNQNWFDLFLKKTIETQSKFFLMANERPSDNQSIKAEAETGSPNINSRDIQQISQLINHNDQNEIKQEKNQLNHENSTSELQGQLRRFVSEQNEENQNLNQYLTKNKIKSQFKKTQTQSENQESKSEIKHSQVESLKAQYITVTVPQQPNNLVTQILSEESEEKPDQKKNKIKSKEKQKENQKENQKEKNKETQKEKKKQKKKEVNKEKEKEKKREFKEKDISKSQKQKKLLTEAQIKKLVRKQVLKLLPQISEMIKSKQNNQIAVSDHVKVENLCKNTFSKCSKCQGELIIPFYINSFLNIRICQQCQKESKQLYSLIKIRDPQLLRKIVWGQPILQTTDKMTVEQHKNPAKFYNQVMKLMVSQIKQNMQNQIAKVKEEKIQKQLKKVHSKSSHQSSD